MFEVVDILLFIWYCCQGNLDPFINNVAVLFFNYFINPYSEYKKPYILGHYGQLSDANLAMYSEFGSFRHIKSQFNNNNNNNIQLYH